MAGTQRVTNMKSFALTEEDNANIIELAERQKTSHSEVIRQALRKLFKEHGLHVTERAY
jgi:Arc/MetJ-type ribon-helix-helix transcriptional regulator